jgi:hypothetical protein
LWLTLEWPRLIALVQKSEEEGGATTSGRVKVKQPQGPCVGLPVLLLGGAEGEGRMMTHPEIRPGLCEGAEKARSWICTDVTEGGWGRAVTGLLL